MKHFQFGKRLLTLGLILGMMVLLGGQPVAVDAQSGNPIVYGSDATAPSNAVFVTAAGNVGVGTQDPSSRLMARTDAGGTTNNILSFATFADDGKGSHFGIDTTSRMMYWRMSDARDYGWQFQTTYGEHARMTITKDGNVGIGHTAPAARLDVAGTTRTDALVVAGTVGIGTADTGPSKLYLRTDAGGTTNNILSFATNADDGKGSHFGIDTTSRMMYWRVSDARDYGWQFQTTYGEHARMTITKDGNVGIGHTAPAARLDVAGTTRTDVLLVNGAVGIGTADTGSSKLYLRTDAGGTTNNILSFATNADTGKGSHFGIDTVNRMMYWRLTDAYDYGWQFQTNHGEHKRMTILQNGNVGIGTTAPQATLDVNGTTSTKVLQITGGSDLAEPFVVSDMDTIEPGTVVVLDPANPGQLRMADGVYDTLVAGIVSGAGGINPGLIMQQESVTSDDAMHPVALTGKVYVKAVGPIKVGDLLTTSDIPGHAMAASDRDRAFGATLGKAMSPLDEGTGLVLVLVALQ